MKTTLQVIAASVLFASATHASSPFGTEKTQDAKYQYTLPKGWTKGLPEKKENGLFMTVHVKKADGQTLAIIKISEMPVTVDTEKAEELLTTSCEEQNYTQDSKKTVKIGAVKAYRHKWSVPSDDGSINLDDLLFVTDKKLYRFEYWYGDATDKETFLGSIKAATGEEPKEPAKEPVIDKGNASQTVQKIQFDLPTPPWKKEAEPKNKATAQFQLVNNRNCVGIVNVFVVGVDQLTPEKYGQAMEADGSTASEEKPDAETAKAVKALGATLIEYVNGEGVHDVSLWIKHAGKLYIVEFVHAGDEDALKAWKDLVKSVKKK